MDWMGQDLLKQGKLGKNSQGIYNELNMGIWINIGNLRFR